MDQPSSTENNPIVLRIRFKSASLDEFIARYSADVSPGGIFIRTRQPVEVGTSLQFDFTLTDGSPLLGGTGTVAWVRESDPSRPNNMPGMGLRFDKLSAQSQQMHQLILAEKARKEGKSLTSTRTPSPQARLSPPPEGPRSPVEESAKSAKAEDSFPSPATFASQVPAPETRAEDGDDFLSGGKTEISDKSIEQRLREMSEVGSGPVSLARISERTVPGSLLQEAKTAPESLASTGGRAAAAQAAGQAQSARSAAPPAKLAAGESAGQENFTSLLDGGETVEVSDAVPTETLPELSGGTPIEEEILAEKTEPVFVPSRAPRAVPASIEVGNAFPEPIQPAAHPVRSKAKARAPKGGGKKLVTVALIVGSVAAAAVYLAKTKPWEEPEESNAPAAEALAVPAPAPTPPTPPPNPAAAANPEPAPSPEAKRAPEPSKPTTVGKSAAGEKPASEKAAAEKQSAAEKPTQEKATAEKAASTKSETTKSASKSGAKSSSKASVETAAAENPAASQAEVYRLLFRSTPTGAEVLIDGEYYGRTPCERTVLDPKKPAAILIRREGYQPYERMLGPSEEWTQKGNERFVRIGAKLKKVHPVENAEAAPLAPPPVGEAKPAPKAEAAPAAKVEPAKPAAEPTEAKKAKPAPSFDEPGKAKE